MRARDRERNQQTDARRPSSRTRGATADAAAEGAGINLREPSLRAAFLRRMRNWTRDLATSAPPSVLADALSEPTARSAMLHVLMALQPVDEESEVRRLRERALERSLLVREQLREAAGGFRSTAWVAEHLKVRRQSVDKRRKEGKLLAMETPHGFEFPACQFTADGVVPGLEDVLDAMSGGSFWETLGGLVSPAPALEGRTIIEALRDARSDRERSRVAALARGYADE